MFQIRHLLKRLVACEKGAEAVEFALIAPILFGLLYGIIEVGRYFWLQSSLDFAVEEGSRYAAVSDDSTASEILALIESHLGQVDRSNVTLNIAEEADAATGMTFKEISASMPFTLSSGFTMPTAMTITAKSTYLVVDE